MTAAPPSAAAEDYPGRALGIVGLVLSIVAGVVGLIISIVALRQSHRAGVRNGLAVGGVIVGAITTIIAVLTIVLTVGVSSLSMNAILRCRDHGGQQIQVAGRTITWPANY